MQLQPLKIHFYPKSDESNDGKHIKCTLYMRLVINGVRTEISLKYDLNKADWDVKNQCLNSMHPNRGYVMNLVNKYRQLAMDAYQQLVQRDMPLDVSIIRLKITGKEKGNEFIEPSLLTLFESIKQRKKALQGKNNSESTVQKYSRCKNLLASFMKTVYKKEDFRFSNINLQFLEDFELYLKTYVQCSHNTTMKHFQTFKTIHKAAMAHGYTDKDPFQKFKIRIEEVNRCYLSEKELEALMELNIPQSGMANARDLFLFCCFTGLSYIHNC